MKKQLLFAFAFFVAIVTHAQFNQHQMPIAYPTDSSIVNEARMIGTPAEFVGGTREFFRFVSKKLKYPKDAKKLGIEGKVSVEFVIDKNGNVLPETVRVVQSLFESCDREAVRVIQLSPRWKPGRLVSGEPSSQKWTMPIIFKL